MQCIQLHGTCRRKTNESTTKVLLPTNSTRLLQEIMSQPLYILLSFPTREINLMAPLKTNVPLALGIKVQELAITRMKGVVILDGSLSLRNMMTHQSKGKDDYCLSFGNLRRLS